jgi:GNAT superfamily N-acetyltransferase
VRIVAWDEVPSARQLDRAALSIGAFSGWLDPRTVRLYRRRRFALSDYVGVAALEGDEVVGQTVVYRLPYRTASGLTTVAGVASVTSRLDRRRRGIASALLEEVHRRERDAGVRFALLWTSQGWFAHRAYEKLGYEDVFTPPLAVRALSRGRRGPRGETLRPARPAELASLEALHGKVHAESHGFAPRPTGFLTVEREAGDLDLGGLLVYRRQGRLAGYAFVARSHALLRCGELVARPRELPALLDAIERAAAPGVLALGNTPAHALRPELGRRGYRGGAAQEWRVLMACPLDGRARGRELARALAVERPSFVCMSLDRF